MEAVYIYIAATILVGCISCFFGRRFYFPVMMLTVFFAVVALGFSFMEMTWRAAAVTIVIGIVAALLARFIYKLGVFLLGGILGGCVSLLLMPFVPEEFAENSWVLIAVMAVIFGFCAVKWCDIFIMASTAYSGAGIMIKPLLLLAFEGDRLAGMVNAEDALITANNVNSYINEVFAAEYARYILVGTVVLALLGFINQYRANKSR